MLKARALVYQALFNSRQKFTTLLHGHNGHFIVTFPTILFAFNKALILSIPSPVNDGGTHVNTLEILSARTIPFHTIIRSL